MLTSDLVVVMMDALVPSAPCVGVTPIGVHLVKRDTLPLFRSFLLPHLPLGLRVEILRSEYFELETQAIDVFAREKTFPLSRASEVKVVTAA